MSTRILIKQLLIDLSIKDLSTLLDKYNDDDIVPACCSEGCMVDKAGECRHKNPSVFVISGRVPQDLDRKGKY